MHMLVTSINVSMCSVIWLLDLGDMQYLAMRLWVSLSDAHCGLVATDDCIDYHCLG